MARLAACVVGVVDLRVDAGTRRGALVAVDHHARPSSMKRRGDMWKKSSPKARARHAPPRRRPGRRWRA
eukprot:3013482-Pyramimonas_sp.AAC.1